MIILEAFKDLTLMKNILHRELPQSINVLGGLHHILRNNVFQLKMCVDSWPTFSTAICYHQNQIGSSFVELPSKYSIFSKNQDTLRSLLSDDKLVKWKNGIEFGVSNHHSEIVREIASLRGLHVEEDGGYHSYINYSPEKLDMPEKTSTLATSTLNESHAELVVQQLPYGGSEEINRVKAYIQHLPNCCVVDEKGHPVSWLLTDELNEMRMAYTQPKYRRKGHFRDMMHTLIRQRISEGLPVYCHMHKDNAAAIGFANKAGFTRGEETTFMFLSASEK
ncbi:glycine N-acyltransferase-like isoform X2 [Syngnathus scovelli]|uniref:glycine N-acyltransferase-like isoform X2 n=1 Tax=Syngnathus scovelli TaxID=161590 RepID=UPI0021100A0D|nr:glycine N-acyltransferase-like isoform X2 [Syngnathus scovelli]